MEKFWLLHILGRIRTDKSFRFGVISLAGLGGLAIIALSTLAIWSGINAATSLIASAAPLPLHQELLSKAREKLSPLLSPDCHQEITSIFRASEWYIKTPQANFAELKNACWQEEKDRCKGLDCEKLLNLYHTAGSENVQKAP